MEEASQAASGASDMFDETPAITLIGQMLVEGLSVRAMIAAGDFIAEAAMRSAEILGRGDKQAANPLLTTLRCDDEARDAAQRAVGMKQRDAMKREHADHALRPFSNQHDGVSGSCAGHDTPFDVGC